MARFDHLEVALDQLSVVGGDALFAQDVFDDLVVGAEDFAV